MGNLWKLCACVWIILSAVGVQKSSCEDLPLIRKCVGAAPLQFEIQASVNYGGPWKSSNMYLYVYPGTQVYFYVRTRMTTLSGDTQGWSFGLAHDPSALQACGGDLQVYGATINGTDTATVNNGGPPSYNSFQVDHDAGYTQGVVIDFSQGVHLPPTSNFVTSLALYLLTVPPYYALPTSATIRFTHDLGNPAVNTVVVQDEESGVPCNKGTTTYFTLYVISSLYSYETYPYPDLDEFTGSSMVFTIPDVVVEETEGEEGAVEATSEIATGGDCLASFTQTYDCLDCLNSSVAVRVPEDAPSIQEAIAIAQIQGKHLICVAFDYVTPGGENPMVVPIELNDLTILAHNNGGELKEGERAAISRTTLNGIDSPLITVNQASFRMQNFSFTGVVSTGEGSFIHADCNTTEKDLAFVLEKCDFRAYTAYPSANPPRAIRVVGPTEADTYAPCVTLSECRFNPDEVSPTDINDGGALRIGGPLAAENEGATGFAGRYESVQIANCVFRNCNRDLIGVPDYGAGAVVALLGTGALDISDTRFINCFVAQMNATAAKGGGLYLFFEQATCPTTLTRCSFEGCYASQFNADTPAQGGALCICGQNSPVTINGESVFRNNGNDYNGYEGHGLYVELEGASTLEIAGAVFTENGTTGTGALTIPSFGGGACIKLRSGATCSLSGGSFYKCGNLGGMFEMTLKGGGLYIDNGPDEVPPPEGRTAGGDVSIVGVSFVENYAGVAGGGLFLKNPHDAYVEVSFFGHNNWKTELNPQIGAGIACEGAAQDKAVTLSGCTFRGSFGKNEGHAIAVLSGVIKFVIGNTIIYDEYWDLHTDPGLILYPPYDPAHPEANDYPNEYAHSNCVQGSLSNWDCEERHLLVSASNPMFADSDTYVLHPDSPCVNAAYRFDAVPENLPPPPAYDIEGKPRPYALDIGAYEVERFRRGYANEDVRLDIGDPIKILGYLFSQKEVSCLDAADVNDDGKIDIADPICLLGYIFAAGAAPPVPFAEEGTDPTSDELKCECWPAPWLTQ